MPDGYMEGLNIWLYVKSIYGIKCVGRIVTKSMPYFLPLCDCCVPYCASLEACNLVVAAKHVDTSHPRSSVWANSNVS